VIAGNPIVVTVMGKLLVHALIVMDLDLQGIGEHQTIWSMLPQRWSPKLLSPVINIMLYDVSV